MFRKEIRQNVDLILVLAFSVEMVMIYGEQNIFVLLFSDNLGRSTIIWQNHDVTEDIKVQFGDFPVVVKLL